MSEQEVNEVFRLWAKFHDETDCGSEGLHWAECEAVADLLIDHGVPDADIAIYDKRYVKP